MSRWHAKPRSLDRFLADLIIEEMARLRPGYPILPPHPWRRDLPIDERGLGLDSLERLTLASVLGEALHLQKSGMDDLLSAGRCVGDWLEIARASLQFSDSLLTFRTSGSSGVQKRCTHASADLEQEAKFLACLLAGRRRVISAVPAHHIYGFIFTLMLPEILRCDEVLDARHATPQSLQNTLRAGDLIISHPAHWALLVKHVQAFPDDVIGVSSTAPCPEGVAQALQERGLRRLVQVYGSSEAGGIGWREAPSEPYRLMPFWSRDVAIDTHLLRRGQDGSERRLSMLDRLLWREDGSFTLGGRIDEVVQVAGTNVYPGRVVDVLLEHPLVQTAAVRLMTPTEGDRLKAYIVPKGPKGQTDIPALRVALTHWVDTRLTVAERPKSFTIGSKIPLTVQGKFADWPALQDDTAHNFQC